MDNFNINNICPVCGYDKLDFKPYDEQDNASFEICPCCGFEFGCDDFPDKQKSFVEWRKNGLRMDAIGSQEIPHRKIGMQKNKLTFFSTKI